MSVRLSRFALRMVHERRTHTYIYIHTYIHTYTHTYIHTYTHTHTHIHTDTHTHTCDRRTQVRTFKKGTNPVGFHVIQRGLIELFVMVTKTQFILKRTERSGKLARGAGGSRTRLHRALPTPTLFRAALVEHCGGEVSHWLVCAECR
jgi:hypothetical protein